MNALERYSLAGRRAIACGSTQGIGRACALQFAQLGASVTLVARNEGALKQVLSELAGPDAGKHDYLVADFNDPAALAGRVGAHLEKTGPAHILLNNSGGPPHGPITDAKPEQFLDAMRRLLICNQLLTQLVLPGMKEARFGRIINIISTSVKEPIPGLGVSNTTRWAVAAWAKTLAGEVAQFGVTVNNLLPGFTATSRLEELFAAKAASNKIPIEQVRKDAIARIPMGRLAEPAEIAAAAGFLASPAASYVTGINLPVDGGRTHCL